MSFDAHSANGLHGEGLFESVADHIRRVHDLAIEFGSAFRGESSAGAAAYLHDLGKYSAQFQRRLRDCNEAGRDHWTLGARALLACKDKRTVMPAAAILGHHVGLDRLMPAASFAAELSKRLTEQPDTFTTSSPDEHRRAMQAFQGDGFALPRMSGEFFCRHDGAADMLDTRMIFSALVDADFLATEGHFDGDAVTPYRRRPSGRELPIDKMLEALDRYVRKLASSSDQPINRLRAELMTACKNAGSQSETGLFTLTAPTGSGKTLAMLRFAMELARRNNIRRIILVMPFLNIVDQTAQIYRDVFPESEFGDDLILESHSLAGRELDDSIDDGTKACELRRRLLSQNWDAPVVLTTNVALLESLHASRPSACRKLHRLARAVLLFDEVQTLPPRLAVTTLATLHRLADPQGPYRSSVVFATATQPAFESLSNRLSELTDPQRMPNAPTWTPTEIAPDAESMFFVAAGRVRVRWREQSAIQLPELAVELAKYRQVLCILNLKRHANSLASELREFRRDTLHLSTNMCAEHRIDVLRIVRDRLDNEQPICLIATQCVEAGVDIDFPVLYRAFAPIEAIAQAAGRCNRSGRRPKCVMTVFTPDDRDERGRMKRPYPPGYQAAVSATELFIANLRAQCEELPEIIHSPVMLRDYFQLLYSLNGRDTAQQNDERELHQAVLATSFVDVSARYRLIEENVLNVIVPYDGDAYERLIVDGNESGQLTRKQIRRWQRLARPHSVAIFRPDDVGNDLYSRLLPIHYGDRDREIGGLETSQIQWWYPATVDSYNDMVGLQLAESQWVM